MMSRLRPGFLSHPEPPIARVPGHLDGCYSAGRVFRHCVPGCPAAQAWNDPRVVRKAYESYESDMARWRSDLRADAPPEDPKEKP